MHNEDLILTLTGGLAAALLFGYVTHRLGLSSIVGYLLAGIAVGPHTPGFVANRQIAEQLSEIGVILLMFIRLAREINPGLRVLARSAYLRDLPALRSAGAEAAFAGEGEVALALTEAILRRLGATPEQIDRERERVHRDLLGPPESAKPATVSAVEPAPGEKTPAPAEPAGGGATGDPPPSRAHK